MPWLAHYGIKGQKWGIRRYQNPDGTLTEEGRQHYGVTTQQVKDRAHLERLASRHTSSNVDSSIKRFLDEADRSHRKDPSRVSTQYKRELSESMLSGFLENNPRPDFLFRKRWDDDYKWHVSEALWTKDLDLFKLAGDLCDAVRKLPENKRAKGYLYAAELLRDSNERSPV